MAAVLIHHSITFFFHDDVICEAQLLRNTAFVVFHKQNILEYVAD